jgi:toluene monooxygenase system protein D
MSDSLLDRVGPVLQHGETARAIIAAIRESNAGVEVLDRGAYLRVLVPGRCVMPRVAVEQSLGRPFVMPGDLEAVMPSFRGNLSLGDDEAVWEYRRRA